MVEIPLSQGKVALIDDEDYELVSRHKWSYDGNGYAITSVYPGKKTLRMHRLILGAPNGVMVDHINHNGLDNRKSNIRLCTSKQNSKNRRAWKNSKSRYKGVYWVADCKKWKCEITIKGRRKYLGIFKTEEEAAKAFNDKAKELHGEFACLNKIEEL